MVAVSLLRNSFPRLFRTSDFIRHWTKSCGTRAPVLVQGICINSRMINIFSCKYMGHGVDKDMAATLPGWRLGSNPEDLLTVDLHISRTTIIWHVLHSCLLVCLFPFHFLGEWYTSRYYLKRFRTRDLVYADISLRNFTRLVRHATWDNQRINHMITGEIYLNTVVEKKRDVFVHAWNTAGTPPCQKKTNRLPAPRALLNTVRRLIKFSKYMSTNFLELMWRVGVNVTSFIFDMWIQTTFDRPNSFSCYPYSNLVIS